MKNKQMILLFTLLCASAINNGMERPQLAGARGLPPEMQANIVREMINEALKEYNNLDEVINNTIKAISKTSEELKAVVNEEYGSQNRFKALVQKLANKFVDISRDTIAKKLGIPNSTKQYVSLGAKLIDAVQTGDINSVTALINQGADVNYSYDHIIGVDVKEKLTPLIIAVIHEKTDIVQLLLEQGANPNFISGHNLKMPGLGEKAQPKAIDYLYSNWKDSWSSQQKSYSTQQKIRIRNLLIKAMAQ